MDAPPSRLAPSAGFMVGLELSLALIALAVAWSVDFSPWIGMRWTGETLGDQFSAVLLGALAAGPMLLVMLLAYYWPVGPLKSVREVTTSQLIPLFSHLTLAEKAAVSIAAGLGEELLFRGLVQGALSDWIGPPNGPWIGLGIAAVVFGICHWLNRAYAVLAAVMGVYFGLLLLWTGNLWTPIVAHALYDFIALLWLTGADGRKAESIEAE